MKIQMEMMTMTDVMNEVDFLAHNPTTPKPPVYPWWQAQINQGEVQVDVPTRRAR